MSIFTEYNIPVNETRFRRAVDRDKHEIKRLEATDTTPLFGEVNVALLIERATLSIVLNNHHMHVIGFMSLCDHPNVPSVDPGAWEDWIKLLFQKCFLSSNTLFVHYMAYDEAVTETFLEDAFISVFKNDENLTNIIFLVPTHCPIEIAARYLTLKKFKMQKHFPKPRAIGRDSTYLYLAKRIDFIPKIKIRKGIEEDNDDIVEILDAYCPNLKDLYERYYISEILGEHPEMQRQILVGEENDEIVAVMCINTEINYKKLQKSYKLHPYSGLMKSALLEKDNDSRGFKKFDRLSDSIMMGQHGPFDNTKKLKDQAAVKQEKVKTRVSDPNTFEEELQGSEHEIFLTKATQTNVPRRAPSIVSNLSLDEDSFDYEIVNIDYSLFLVPDVSFDQTAEIRSSTSMDTEVRYSRNKHDDKFYEPIPRWRAPSIKHNVHTKGGTSDENLSHMYSDIPNAFMIELYGVRVGFDDRRCFELLKAAFMTVPQVDYCLMRIPCDTVFFPLLRQFSFVPLKINSENEYALYVAHKNSVSGTIKVRLAEIADIPQIQKLVCNLDGKESLNCVEDQIRTNHECIVFVFHCGIDLIGFAVIEPLNVITYIITHFDTDAFHNHKYHYQNHGLGMGYFSLKTLIVFPVYEPHFRFLIGEILRKSGALGLFWLTNYSSKMILQRANTLISAMIPLLPRRTVARETIPDLKKYIDVKHAGNEFSAWFINNRLTSVNRVNIDTRIVIVGTSLKTLGFLHALLFSDARTYLTFTNVTLIASDALAPFGKHHRRAERLMFPHHPVTTDRYLKGFPLHYYVNVVMGNVEEINRFDQYVVLKSGQQCCYDKLILLYKKRYLMPETSPPAKYSFIDILKTPCLRNPNNTLVVEIPLVPKNVFLINSPNTASKAFQYIEKLRENNGVRSTGTDPEDQSKPNDTIIVYGSSIDAYCCLTALVDANVPVDTIHFVEPFPPKNRQDMRVSVFCNEYVDMTILEVIERLKIKVFRSYYFMSWTINADDTVSAVNFISTFSIIKMPCSVVFFYEKQGICTRDFNTINKANVPYDGGILIDHNFQTKDPHIYAGGSLTKYYRAYFADKLQANYDPFEIGEKLGEKIRNDLDPLFKESVKESDGKRTVKFASDKDSQDLSLLLPKFKKPMVTHCILPGNMEYLEVRPPGKRDPHHYLQSQQYNGQVIETFKGGYFKLHLTRSLYVDGVTCLITQSQVTGQDYILGKFSKLYGLPAAMLNNLDIRFAAHKIDNLFAYFNEPWAHFLYHDSRDELMSLIKELLPKGIGDRTITENLMDLRQAMTDDIAGSVDIRYDFEKSFQFQAITEFVLNWVSENLEFLPMYIQPDHVTMYQYDTAPYFKKKKRMLTSLLLQNIIN